MMKSLFLCVLVLTALFLVNCGSNEIQLPDQRVTGLVGGEPWDYKSANAYKYSSDLKYEIKILSNKEFGEDPCTVPSPGNPYISFIIPLSEGSRTFPLPLIQESARFHISAGNTPIATSGFLEIFLIDNLKIFGYIQAILDDDNSVEGSFEATICN